MYSLTSANKYYLYQGFIWMNLGINGLYKLVRSEMSQLSPVSGDAFIFFGKRRDGVKILRWDGDGFLLYYKRLGGGTFELPTFNPHTGHYEVPYTYPKWRIVTVCTASETLQAVDLMPLPLKIVNKTASLFLA